MHAFMTEMSHEAMKITAELNGSYHTAEEIRQLFSELIGKPVDASFGMFPPFYTDCGKNITLGKNVFINSSCHFQDQGGITIGDGTLIGHNVTLATLNHDFRISDRASMYPKPVHIGKNVWIGSGAVIVPGITVGDGAVVAAGAVVIEDVPPATVVAGVPAAAVRELTEEEKKQF